MGVVDQRDDELTENVLDQPGAPRSLRAAKGDLLYEVSFDNGVTLYDLPAQLPSLDVKHANERAMQRSVLQGMAQRGRKETRARFSTEQQTGEFHQEHHGTNNNSEIPSGDGVDSEQQRRLQDKLVRMQSLMRQMQDLNNDLIKTKVTLENEQFKLDERVLSMEQVTTTLATCVEKLTESSDEGEGHNLTGVLLQLLHTYEQRIAEDKIRINESRILMDGANKCFSHWGTCLLVAGERLADSAEMTISRKSRGEGDVLSPPLLCGADKASKPSQKRSPVSAFAREVRNFYQSKVGRPLRIASFFLKLLTWKHAPRCAEAVEHSTPSNWTLAAIGLVNCSQVLRAFRIITSRRKMELHSIALMGGAATGALACLARLGGHNRPQSPQGKVRRWCDFAEAGVSPLLLLPVGSVALRSGATTAKRLPRVIAQSVVATLAVVSAINQWHSTDYGRPVGRFKKEEPTNLAAFAVLGTVAGVQAACWDARLSFLPFAMALSLPLSQVGAMDQNKVGVRACASAGSRLLHVGSLLSADSLLPV